MKKIDTENRRELTSLYDKLLRAGRGSYASVLGRYRVPYALIESHEIPKWLTQTYGFSSYKADIEESDMEEVGAFLFDRQRRGIADISPIYYDFVRNGNFLIFVNAEMVPERFNDIVTVHEFAEGYAHDDSIAEHYEFREAMRRGLAFFIDYARWWVERREVKTEEQKEYFRSILPQGTIPFIEAVGIL
jgi:hypothetical protein